MNTQEAFIRGFIKAATDVPLPVELRTNLVRLAQSPTTVQSNALNAVKNIQQPLVTPTISQVLAYKMNPFSTNLEKNFSSWGNTNALKDFQAALNGSTNYTADINKLISSKTPEAFWFRQAMQNPANQPFLTAMTRAVSADRPGL